MIRMGELDVEFEGAFIADGGAAEFEGDGGKSVVVGQGAVLEVALDLEFSNSLIEVESIGSLGVKGDGFLEILSLDGDLTIQRKRRRAVEFFFVNVEPVELLKRMGDMEFDFLTLLLEVVSRNTLFPFTFLLNGSDCADF